MSSMWEVDPETKVKLLQLSKTNGNEKCCDCGAPAPQWASPKFGTFICLNCAGTHRGLGVHISFVRSITMDAFKHAEIQRMEMGGNEPWKTFFDEHPITQSEGRTFEDSTIKERYEGEVGEEWKERLAAKVEGREYVPGAAKKKTTTTTTAAARGMQSKGSSGASTPLSNTGSPALSGGGGMEGFGSDTMSKKERNEAYFARMGSENATRSESLPPSQGGKYTGFGGGMPPTSSSSSSSPARRSQFGAVPGFEDFQKDPVATLTKGFGWFASAVGKGAKTMNDSYIQPTAKTIAESDFAAQARMHAMQVGQNVQQGARGAADSFNRFVEGPDDSRGRTEPERKDFWDDFSSIASQQHQDSSHHRSASRSSALGTSAMKKQDTPGPGPASSTAAAAAAPGKEKDDGWDDNW